MIKALQLAAILFTAVTMSAAWAHLLELPKKINLSRDEYLTVQQIYRGWNLLGVAVFGALITTMLLTITQRGKRAPFYYALLATVCIAVSLGIFFSITFPTNQLTDNWTQLPDNWQSLRRQWEYSHATNAVLYFIAMVGLAMSVITGK